MSEISLVNNVTSTMIKGSKSKYEKCFVVILVIVVLLACTCSYFFYRVDASLVENRAMQKFPVLTIAKYIDNDFQNKFEKALSDQYFLRNKSITFYKSLEYAFNKKIYLVLN